MLKVLFFLGGEEFDALSFMEALLDLNGKNTAILFKKRIF